MIIQKPEKSTNIFHACQKSNIVMPDKLKKANPKPVQIKGISDRELVIKYEAGKIDMKKIVKPLLKPPHAQNHEDG